MLARARRARPHWTGGGVAFPPQMRSFEVKVNRKAWRAALRGALAAHAQSRHRSPWSTALPGRNLPRRPRSRCVEAWGKQRPLVLVVARRRGQPGEVVPQPRARSRSSTPSELEVAAVVWARSLLVSQAALERRPGARRRRPAAATERGGRGVSLTARQVLIAPVVSEKSYSLIEDAQVRVPRASGRAQDPDPPGRRGALRRQGRSAVNVSKVQPKPKRRGPCTRARSRAGRRRSSRCARATRSRSSQGAQV